MSNFGSELLELIKPIDLSSLTTYCGELSRIIPPKTEHFTRKDLYYTACGIEAVYLCGIDNREYVVSIQPKKGE